MKLKKIYIFFLFNCIAKQQTIRLLEKSSDPEKTVKLILTSDNEFTDILAITLICFNLHQSLLMAPSKLQKGLKIKPPLSGQSARVGFGK